MLGLRCQDMAFAPVSPFSWKHGLPRRGVTYSPRPGESSRFGYAEGGSDIRQTTRQTTRQNQGLLDFNYLI